MKVIRIRRVGFTGTRKGMTPAQKRVFTQMLPANMAIFYHGGAIGADHDAHKLVRLHKPEVTIFVRPSNLASQRADIAPSTNVQVYRAVDPLERNRVIVDQSELMIACPGEKQEVQRSGTWATIRYARRNGKPLVIIYPDGTKVRA